MIYKYISQLANMQRRLIDKLSNGKEYSGTEGKVMHYLFTNQDKTIYQKNIEEVFGLRAASATQVINSLEKMGVSRRIQSRADGRYKEIVLTEKANEYREDIFCGIDALEQRIVRGIEPEQLDIWCEITNKMIENLKES